SQSHANGRMPCDRVTWFFSRLLTCSFFAVVLPGVVDAQMAQAASRGADSQPHFISREDHERLRRDAGKVTAEALALLKEKGEAGDVRSQLLIAVAYDLGSVGVKKDKKEALAWYRKAADQGNGIAENMVGLLYDRGAESAGISPDFKEAMKWYRKAAAHGASIGEENIGSMFRRGDGVFADCSEAAVWYQRAMEHGHPFAALVLVRLYDEGDVLPTRNRHENQQAAVQLFQQLAAAGNAGAQAVLGRAYHRGWLGLHRDDKQAFILFRKSAEQGFSKAQIAVSDMYFYGAGGAPRDESE